MNKTNPKSKYEMEVFKKFTAVIWPYYKINKNTIRSLTPPSPDIYIESEDGQKFYFEITECIDNAIAKQTGDILKSLRVNKNLPESYKTVAFKEKLLFKSSMEKFQKEYEADGPIELLSYFNQQPKPLEDILLESYRDFVKEYLKKSPFTRVWVYDVFHNKILFHFPDTENITNC